MAVGNNLTVTGNITSDIELKVTPSGTEVAKFGIAWNRRRKVNDEWQEDPHFFDVTCWGDLATNVTESFRKGDRVTVVGWLEQSRWEDRETGKGRSKLGIVADDVAGSARFAEVAMTKVQGGGQQRSSGGRGEHRAPAPEPARQPRGGADYYDDEVPF